LIGLLGEDNRFKTDAAEALFRITAYDFGADHQMWEKQWANLKSLNFRIPTDEEMEKAAKARAEAAKQYKPEPGKKNYHGIETMSTQVLFVIDVSGSMVDLILDREKWRQDGYQGSFEKLEIVKNELVNTIKDLDENTNFNIIAFATKIKTWKNWLVQGNNVNRASAISWVNRLKPIGAKADMFSGGLGGGGAGLEEGKTNTFGALMQAFDLDPAMDVVITGGSPPKNKLDTILFLSDGRPTVGEFVDTNDILERVKKANEVRKIVLHTIAIGDFQKSFLQSLAEQNGGVFVDLGR
jgi:hypothetical protein